MTDTKLTHGATPGQLEAFLVNLENTANVAKSAREAGITKYIVYERRKGDPVFAQRWADAVAPTSDARFDAFLEHLVCTGVVSKSRRAVGLSRRAVYERRANDPLFALCWDFAVEEAAPDVRLLSAVVSNQPLEPADLRRELRRLNRKAARARSRS